MSAIHSQMTQKKKKIREGENDKKLGKMLNGWILEELY